MKVSRSTRFFFDSAEGAAEALLAVLDDARTTSSEYRFGPTAFEQAYASGLTIEGDIEKVSSLLDNIEGTTRFDD